MAKPPANNRSKRAHQQLHAVPPVHATSEINAPPANLLLKAYKIMLRARLIDERAIILYKQNKCHFQIGVAGHEAVQVAAAQAFRVGTDWFYPYYRDMAFCSAIGMTDEEFFLNIMNKEADPNSHGRMMPMHYGHAGLNIVQQSSPTGTQFLQAVGCALTSKKKGFDEVTYVSSGEGACAQGDFHEAVNWAAREKLPIIFLIQNNEYAISVPVADEIAGGSVAEMVRGYKGLYSSQVDGTDFAISLSTLKNAYNRARRGDGPSVIEAHVPRLQSHSISDNQLKYRTPEELDRDKERCPILKMRRLILSLDYATERDLGVIEGELRQEIMSASDRAEAKPDCDPHMCTSSTYSNPSPWRGVDEQEAQGNEVFMVDALNHALDEELSRDSNVFVFGEDVAGGKGGVFTVTAGLTAKYGPDRVFNAPLAESSIAGVSIGMATRGLKPVAEIQFGDYIWTAMMQIRNELAMLHYRSGGDFACPAVIRVPVGGYIQGGCYHSQNIEATFAHFPGLHVVYPSNATDAKGLLKAAIRCSDPVLFLEHKGLYRQVYAKGPEGDKDSLVPIGKGRTMRQGDDLTIITWGALVQKSLLAADTLEKEGYSIEVIDIRSILPLDMDLISDSIRKTGRALIAHEDSIFMGFGAEIAAQVAERCFTMLDAPVKRLGMKEVAGVPHSPILEKAILPQTEAVIAACEEVLSF